MSTQPSRKRSSPVFAFGADHAQTKEEQTRYVSKKERLTLEKAQKEEYKPAIQIQRGLTWCW